MEILGADFFDWLCDGSDVNEAFKLDEVADLNLPSDLICLTQVDSTPEISSRVQRCGKSVGLKPIIH